MDRNDPTDGRFPPTRQSRSSYKTILKKRRAAEMEQKNVRFSSAPESIIPPLIDDGDDSDEQVPVRYPYSCLFEERDIDKLNKLRAERFSRARGIATTSGARPSASHSPSPFGSGAASPQNERWTVSPTPQTQAASDVPTDGVERTPSASLSGVLAGLAMETGPSNAVPRNEPSTSSGPDAVPGPSRQNHNNNSSRSRARSHDKEDHVHLDLEKARAIKRKYLLHKIERKYSTIAENDANPPAHDELYDLDKVHVVKTFMKRVRMKRLSSKPRFGLKRSSSRRFYPRGYLQTEKRLTYKSIKRGYKCKHSGDTARQASNIEAGNMIMARFQKENEAKIFARRMKRKRLQRKGRFGCLRSKEKTIREIKSKDKVSAPICNKSIDPNLQVAQQAGNGREEEKMDCSFGSNTSRTSIASLDTSNMNNNNNDSDDESQEDEDKSHNEEFSKLAYKYQRTVNTVDNAAPTQFTSGSYSVPPFGCMSASGNASFAMKRTAAMMNAVIPENNNMDTSSSSGTAPPRAQPFFIMASEVSHLNSNRMAGAPRLFAKAVRPSQRQSVVEAGPSCSQQPQQQPNPQAMEYGNMDSSIEDEAME